MKKKHCSGARLLQPFLLLICSFYYGLFPSLAHAQLPRLTWKPGQAQEPTTPMLFHNESIVISLGRIQYLT